MPVFLQPAKALEWLSLDEKNKSKPFLLEFNQNKKLQLAITIDRKLKEGWQKNAPEASDITELKKLIG